MPLRILGVIPARYASRRFPGKVLALLCGKPVIQHVYERACGAKLIEKLVIATDDPRIQTAASSFGAPVVLTRADHPSGTDRVAEVAQAIQAEIVVNIQGDEPLIDPAAIDQAVGALLENPQISMGTLKRRIVDPEEISNPNVVKVVTNRSGEALYFSRAPIPYHPTAQAEYYKHIGLYVYRREFLLQYPKLPVGPLEQTERLEQLRALENGYRIQVVETQYDSIGVDTPEDLARIERLMLAARS